VAPWLQGLLKHSSVSVNENKINISNDFFIPDYWQSSFKLFHNDWLFVSLLKIYHNNITKCMFMWCQDCLKLMIFKWLTT
jgi:hypothetical protein